MRRMPGTGIGTLLATLLGTVLAPIGEAQESQPLRSTLDLQVQMPPAIVRVDGELRLVYELHLTNFTPADLVLKRIEVFDAGGGTVGDLKDTELMTALSRPAGLPTGADARQLSTGARAIAYLWLELYRGKPVPQSIRHRLELDVMRSGNPEHAIVEGPAVAVRQEPPMMLALPLQGGPWTAVYEPSMERGHRRVFYAIGGRARLPARFAIDFFKVDEKGKSSNGDAAVFENWFGYGAEVLAVADAVVAATRDDIAEAAAFPDGSRPRNPPENASGNYIALDLGQGHYAFYEHLKPGSLLVAPGDRVRSGQPIAALGSTGDSMGPHLHFHVSDANATLAAEGLPYVFDRFDVLGAYDSIEAFGEGAQWKSLSQAAPKSRAAELPGANSVVAFPIR